MKLAEVIDNLSVNKIAVYWTANVATFGIAYYALNYAGSAIINGAPLTTNLAGFGDSLYLSFITALTIGYNNLAPTGIAKPLIIIEAIASMALFGMFITKLVATKQDHILKEIQELSFEEATNKAITQFYMFRNQASEIKKNSGKSTISKDYELSIQNFREALKTFNDSNPVIKDNGIALRHISLITNSITFSCSRLVELLEEFNSKKIDWNKESTTSTIKEVERIKET